MKKKFAAILAASILFGANFANAEDAGAAAAPAEINHSNSIYFPEIDFYNMTSTDSLIILPNYPTYQQTTEYTCGPAAALTVLQYYKNYNFDEMQLAAEMKTSNTVGTNTANLAKFFEKIGWKVQSSLNSKPVESYADFQNFVVKNLRLGRPILVENVEWGGHWRVIIGYDSLKTEELDDDVLIFAEPYDTTDAAQDGYSFGSFDRFYWMWFDHNILPKNERNQPWLIATPK